MLADAAASCWVEIVDTGSMRPLLRDRDSALVQFGDRLTLRMGDFALFRDARTGHLFVHRVLEVSPEGGVRQVGNILQAGNWLDQSVVGATDVLGRVSSFCKKGTERNRNMDSMQGRLARRALSYLERNAYSLEQHACEGHSGVGRAVARALSIFCFADRGVCAFSR